MSRPATLRLALEEFLGSHSRQRVTLDELWTAAARHDRFLVGAHEHRQSLAAAIDEMVADTIVALPDPDNSRAWDARSLPRLPAWVQKPPRPDLTTAPTPTPRVWRHALAQAASLASSPKDVRRVEQVADWMRDHLDPESVPIEERSLEVFGDEKALGQLTKNKLFTSGALTLDLLACHRTPLPLASQYVPGEGAAQLLIAENNATFSSLLIVARSLPRATRPNVHVAWGSGYQIPAAIEGAVLLEPAPESIVYFGDLDLSGIQVAVAAAASAQRLGLPALRPATALYHWLRDNGCARHDRSNRSAAADHRPLIDWFPADLHEFVGHLLRARLRVAQETVGLSVLRRHPDLIRAACSAPPSPDHG